MSNVPSGHPEIPEGRLVQVKIGTVDVTRDVERVELHETEDDITTVRFALSRQGRGASKVHG